MAATSQERLQQLEREAALARASLERTIAEIRQRLEADRLKQDAERIGQQLMERARERGAQMIQERRAQLKDKVVTAAMNNPAPVLALGTLVGWSLWRRLREIPPPILLVAAGGIAGLMRWNDGGAEGERPRHRLGYGRAERTRLEPPLAGSRWDTATEAGPREQHGDMATRAREVAAETGARISEATERVRDAASETGARIAETAERAREVVSDTAERTAAGISRAVGDASGTASDLGRQARSQFYDLVDKHPLVLGGIGLAIGAALAAAMRPTETEARLIGETSDRFRRRARELGEAQFERAQAMAERAYEAGWHEARAQGLSVDAGREAGSEVGDKPAAARRAKKAAKEEATS